MSTKKRSTSFLLGFLGILFVLGSLFIPVTLDHPAQNVQLRLGLPFKFIIQEQHVGGIGVPDGLQLPYPLRFSSPWENPTQFLWLPFLADVFSVWIILFLVTWTGERFLKYVILSPMAK